MDATYCTGCNKIVPDSKFGSIAGAGYMLIQPCGDCVDHVKEIFQDADDEADRLWEQERQRDKLIERFGFLLTGWLLGMIVGAILMGYLT